MYSWTIRSLVDEVCGPEPASDAPGEDQEAYARKMQSVEQFLRRAYDEMRNLGVAPHDRALNYAATNALLIAKVYEDALRDGMTLDTIEVERGPICRPSSDCWDVKVAFFNPNRIFEQARKVYRFTVDVSDAVPVMVGQVRAWFVR